MEYMIMPMLILASAMLIIGFIVGYKLGYKDGFREAKILFKGR